MSAFNVSVDHIAHIAAGATRLFGFEKTGMIAATLAKANAISVAHRYSEAPAITHMPESAVRRAVAQPVTDGQLYKLVECFEYQSCEHPSWNSSPSFKMCGAIKMMLTANGAKGSAEYKAAKWSI